MSAHSRPDPRSKPVSLFVTCMIDMIYPQTGISVVEILEHLGVEVRFPMSQTCCGQPAYNSGFHDETRSVGRQFLTAFAEAEVIVTPSGSCASMIRHFYPDLFKDDPAWAAKAQRAADITWEFTEFLVDGLGVTDLGAAVQPTKVAFHDSCHGLRMMGLHDQVRKLAEGVQGVTITEMTNNDRCCGFGGLFSVKMPDISGAMLEDKLKCISGCDADCVLTSDSSCLTQMNGGLARKGEAKRVQHIADFLSEAMKK